MTARGGRALATAHAESAAAVLCVELEQHGLPIDRATARRLVTDAAGDEPHSLDEELAARSTRDAPEAISSQSPSRRRTASSPPAPRTCGA